MSLNPFAVYQDSILDEWSHNNMYKIFDISKRDKSENNFTFLAGPPFCSGKLHIGHCAIETIKSTMLNYKAMQGYTCSNKMGYDCHGLPIESIANRELNIVTTADLERVGITAFNQFCKDTIKQCERDWEPVYNKIGRWANFTNVYKTVDLEFMESVWWAFNELYKKNLIYRGYKITPYSYALQSPLSNFEASQNYKEVDCRSLYVKFALLPEYNYVDVDIDGVDDTSRPTYFVAWTTTPWTLPANIALCVNRNLEYEYIIDMDSPTNGVYILGKGKAKQAGFKNVKVLKTVMGKDLVGMKYSPMYNTYNHLDVTNAYVMLDDDYVKDGQSTGTNIVHLAPVFGEDDNRVCKKHHLITNETIASLIPIDDNCKYLAIVEKYVGMLVFDAEIQIIKDLKESKTLIKIQQIRHEYPYCYRTDTPLVYRTYKSLYVNVQPIKQRMLELNQCINWYPETKRFQQWLENATDWCISRSRYFGTPIPVWIACDSDDEDILVISSVEELQQYTDVKLTDIHPEHINDIEIVKNGRKYRRILDVFDCWFESGSVPFAQYHYPFENRELVDEQIRCGSFADFIAEGLDQTRGWFYTLMVLSTAIFDIMPARNIMSIGHIQDEHHKKISKKNKNYVDPLDLMDKYGTDAIRLYLLQSGISNGESLAFKEDDLVIINKDLIQLKHSVDFLLEHITNQKHHGVTFDILAYQANHLLTPMDKWILQHMYNIHKQVIIYMNNYQISKATRTIINTIEDISNWYLKFNRDRLKGKCGNEDWIISTSTLFHVIYKYIVILAPFAPFITQIIYKQLATVYPDMKQFVHLEDYSIYLDLLDSENYIETFNVLKRVSKLVRTARMNTLTHTSAKTPIKSCEICMDNLEMLDKVASCIELIQSELNVIDIKYSMLSGNLKYRCIPNKTIMGKKYKQFASKLYTKMNELVFDNTDAVEITLSMYGDGVDNVVYVLSKDEFNYEPIFEKNYQFDNQVDNNILIKIDFTYDENIEKLAHFKRFITDIQRCRKNMGLKPWNRIIIHIFKDDFNVVNDNVDTMIKRLECEVLPNSMIPVMLDNVLYYKTDDKQIMYYIELMPN